MIIEGKVIKGDQRGRKQGYPTANLSPQVIKQKLAKGVYACFTKHNSHNEKSVLIYGAPDIKGNSKLEVYFLRKPINVYNKKISVEIIKKIRPLKRFKSKQEFINQIKKDIKKAKEILDRF